MAGLSCSKQLHLRQNQHGFMSAKMRTCLSSCCLSPGDLLERRLRLLQQVCCRLGLLSSLDRQHPQSPAWQALHVLQAIKSLLHVLSLVWCHVQSPIHRRRPHLVNQRLAWRIAKKHRDRPAGAAAPSSRTPALRLRTARAAAPRFWLAGWQRPAQGAVPWSRHSAGVHQLPSGTRPNSAAPSPSLPQLARAA